MAQNAVQICNKALIRIGILQLMSDLSEATTSANVCNALYPLAREEVLAEVPWPFATGRASLPAPLDVTRSGWAHAYALPTDCLTTRGLYTGSRNPGRASKASYALEYDATFGKLLLTDQAEAELLYTVNIQDVTKFPPLFVDALAWKLAADLAMGIAKKPQLAVAMLQQYKQALLGAAAADLNQAQADVPPQAEHILAR